DGRCARGGARGTSGRTRRDGRGPGADGPCVGPRGADQASAAAMRFLPTRGWSTFSAKVIRKARAYRTTNAQTTPMFPPQGRTTATTAEPRKVAPPAAVVYIAIAAPLWSGASAGMIAPSGTKPASRMPKTVPAMTATTKPQPEPAGTQCGTYHHSSRPIEEPTMPNQRTVVVQPMRSPRAPKAALNRMLPAKTIEVISSQRLCPPPRVSAMTVGRMMDMPDGG